MTRRIAAAALVMAFALVAARAEDAGDAVVRGPHAAAEPWSDADPWNEGPPRGAPYALDALLESTKALRAARWSATVTALRLTRHGTSADAFVHGNAPLATDGDLAAMREAVAGRAARVEHRVVVTGGSGETVVGEDLTTRPVQIAREGESAVGAAAVWTRQGAVDQGLAARVAAAPTGDGRWRVRVAIRWSEAADIAPTAWIDDQRLDRVRVSVLLAETSFDTRPGETAAFRATGAAGTQVVLVRIDGAAPSTTAVREIAGDHVAVAGVPDPSIEGAEWPAPDPMPRRGATTSPGSGGGATAERIEWLDVGVGAFRIGKLLRGTIEEAERAFAARTGIGAVEVRRFAGPRFVVPAAPGSAFRVFAGVLETRLDGIGVRPGCETCLLMEEQTTLGATGVGVAGVTSPDGSVDADLASRRVLDERTFESTGRRDLPGHVAGAPLVTRVPMRRLREVAVGGCAAPGDDRFGPGTTLRFHAPPEAARADDPWKAAPPVALRIGDAQVGCRPGAEARVLDRVVHPFVLRWESDGWCGMRARFPNVRGVAEGTEISAALSEDGATADVVAEIRGAPELLGRVEPGDGQIDVVRAPFLRYATTRLALPVDGVVAADAYASVRVGLVRPVGGASAQRTVLRLGAAWCLADTEDRVVLASGAETNLPTSSYLQSSSHQTAELRSVATLVLDGVRADLAPADEGARRLAVAWSSRPTWTQRDLRISTAPQREGETHLARVWPRRALRSASFGVVPGRVFRREPTSAQDLPFIQLGPAEPRGDRR